MVDKYQQDPADSNREGEVCEFPEGGFTLKITTIHITDSEGQVIEQETGISLGRYLSRNISEIDAKMLQEMLDDTVTKTGLHTLYVRDQGLDAQDFLKIYIQAGITTIVARKTIGDSGWIVSKRGFLDPSKVKIDRANTNETKIKEFVSRLQEINFNDDMVRTRIIITWCLYEEVRSNNEFPKYIQSDILCKQLQDISFPTIILILLGKINPRTAHFDYSNARNVFLEQLISFLEGRPKTKNFFNALLKENSNDLRSKTVTKHNEGDALGNLRMLEIYRYYTTNDFTNIEKLISQFLTNNGNSSIEWTKTIQAYLEYYTPGSSLTLEEIGKRKEINISRQAVSQRFSRISEAIEELLSENQPEEL